MPSVGDRSLHLCPSVVGHRNLSAATAKELASQPPRVGHHPLPFLSALAVSTRSSDFRCVCVPLPVHRQCSRAMTVILKIVLASEKIAYTLDKAPPKEAAVNATPDELEKLEKWSDHYLQARCYMLALMSNELQRWFEETVDTKDIHIHLQELYDAQTRSVRHAIVKELITARMQDGALVHEHGVKMIGLIEKLINLYLVIPHELLVDIILLSLPSSFDNFVLNFNMNKLEATLEELVNMLANYEATMKKEKSISLWAHLLDLRNDPRKRERNILPL
ncbi:hypothetical protein ZIOFF_028513 [Zingiber officinale]|uniref:Uncharacterized protein n=1 Tax=Zingiber officinale TaxID=94328 RepID=A0A8J5GW15_ZINOF|nr:hypothetical protein ZIOFF_028513 [Zingiber officinale]